MKKKITIFFMLIVLALNACTSSSKQQGKIIFKVQNGEPTSLDPQLATDTNAHYILMNLFSGITNKDSKTGGHKPGLAKSWEVSKNGTVYTFKLRDDIYWSDDVPITAEDIRKSYLRILNKELNSEYVDLVKTTIKNGKEYYDGKVSDSELGIKATDKKTLEITITSPKPYFLDMLTHQSFVPIPIHAVEKYGTNWTKPENMVVSGAYNLKERLPDDKITVIKNNKYYNAKNVQIDEVIFYSIKENTTAYNMYLNEELDFIRNIPIDFLDEARTRNDYYTAAKNRMSYIAFNVTRKPLDDPKVRQALTLAIDRETLSNVILKQSTSPTRNITPLFDNYSYGEKLTLFDPEKAKMLLDEAGYPDGKGFPTIKYKFPTNEEQKIKGEFYQDQFKKILNINLELEHEDWTSFLVSRKDGNYDLSYAGWSGDYFDPLTFFESLFTKENYGFGAYKYSNKEYDELIQKSNFEIDILKRQDILRKAERILVRQDFPMAPTEEGKSHYLFRYDKWTGWHPNISESYLYEDIKPKKEYNKY